MSSLRRTAFSLVELLVVIAVIVVLAGMLLTVMPMVRGGARATVCLNDLRQLGMATLAYCNDNNGVIPGTKVYTQWTTLTTAQCPWGAFHLDQIKTYLEDEWATSGEDNFRGVLWGCPEHTARIREGPRSTAGWGANATYAGYVRNDRLTRSSTNQWAKSDDLYDLCFPDGTSRWGNSTWFALSALSWPAEVCLFGEGAYNQLSTEVDWNVPGSFSANRQLLFDGQPLNIDPGRHRGRSNLLYCDMHVASAQPLAFWYALTQPDKTP